MKHISLFTGLGGFDLAAHWMNWENILMVEIDKYCQKILNKNFPDTPIHDNIFTLNAKQYEYTIDILSGGFPCQPFSVAGKRRSETDDRYLWPQMFRVISEVKPPYVICENVTGIVNLALEQVLIDLESIGYQTETYIIPACSKNAWHRRDRVWILAYSHTNDNNRRSSKIQTESKGKRIPKRNQIQLPQLTSNLRKLPSDTISQRCNNRGNSGEVGHYKDNRGLTQENNPKRNKRQSGIGQIDTISSDTGSIRSNESKSGDKSKLINQNGKKGAATTNPNEERCQELRKQITKGQKLTSPRCDSWWQAEPGMGRVVNGIPNRVDRLKALGNAIVPQVAYELFQAIQHHADTVIRNS